MPPSAATNRAATRASRRQHGSINSAVSTDHQPPSCLSKALPISLCCSSCKARSDPILFGNRNKENICRQLWIEGNCVTLEDGHARALITDHLNIQGSAALITAAATAPASTTIQPRAPLFSISVMARARAAAGYNPRRHSLPSVSPPPPPPTPPRHTSNMGQCTPAARLCVGIASGNSGSILSYLASSFRSSASQLISMSHEKDFGVEQFNKSPFSGNANIVAPHGNMITKKMTDGKGYQIFSKNCLGTTTALVKNQRVPRCSSCLTSTGVGNKFINRQHNPVFVPHGAKTNIGIIANQPNQASHEIQRLCKFVSNAKRQIAKQVCRAMRRTQVFTTDQQIQHDGG